MWKLMGSSVLAAAAHRRSQEGSPGSNSKTSMIAPRCPISAHRSSSRTAASGEWLGRNGRTHSRSGAAALNSSTAQSFHAA